MECLRGVRFRALFPGLHQSGLQCLSGEVRSTHAHHIVPWTWAFVRLVWRRAAENFTAVIRYVLCIETRTPMKVLSQGVSIDRPGELTSPRDRSGELEVKACLWSMSTPSLVWSSSHDPHVCVNVVACFDSRDDWPCPGTS